jgi:hypothetical protein
MTLVRQLDQDADQRASASRMSALSSVLSVLMRTLYAHVGDIRDPFTSPVGHINVSEIHIGPLSRERNRCSMSGPSVCR